MRLLVVEDEQDLRLLLSNALRDVGYAVDAVGDGEEGLAKAVHCEYDAIILDVMLPGMDGLRFLENLRRIRKTPVLILTARDGLSDRIEGLDSGADDYLVKPFELRELLARLRAVIRRATGQATARLEIGTTAIDTSARKVFQEGTEVFLTAREYALVELLALQRGRLVTRHRIYEHLFDDQDEALSNLVEVHVSNVRKKLGKDFIKTRRGQGYIIDG